MQTWVDRACCQHRWELMMKNPWQLAAGHISHIVDELLPEAIVMSCKLLTMVYCNCCRSLVPAQWLLLLLQPSVWLDKHTYAWTIICRCSSLLLLVTLTSISKNWGLWSPSLCVWSHWCIVFCCWLTLCYWCTCSNSMHYSSVFWLMVN